MPVWPDDAAESAFLAGQMPADLIAPPSPSVEVEPAVEEKPAAFPALDSLVNRIPVEAREVLEELFRARFISVKKVPKRVLKS